MRYFKQMSRLALPTNMVFGIFLIFGFMHGCSASSDFQNNSNRAVLVLGSGGLVGRAMVAWLTERNYVVLEVRNRNHIDLRVPGALDVFNSSNVSYCIFLACEVGGSKFIESTARNIQTDIIESNLRIYQTVLPWLVAHKVPFVFTSSYLQGTENSYGVIKRLGEVWISNLGGLGKIMRLWNVYGPERVGLKSHVLSDWASQCASTGRAKSLTDGLEERQFIHVNDTASACGTAMLHHNELDMISDVSTGYWVTMREVAAALANASGDTCEVQFATNPAGYRMRLSAQLTGKLHSLWSAKVTLEEGCKKLLEEYQTCQNLSAFL